MGCDIHMYVEYKRKDSEFIHNFGKRINPGRNYTMFGLLSKGVRRDLKEGVSPKGIPDKVGWSTSSDLYLLINDDADPNWEGYCSLSSAILWGGEIIKDAEGKPIRTTHPDWHSHSYLDADEFEKVIQTYKEIYETEAGEDPEYYALSAAMQSLKNSGLDVRVVFWFDN